MSRAALAGLLVAMTCLSVGPSRCEAVSQAGGIVDVFEPSARWTALAGIYSLNDGGPEAVRSNPAGLALGRRSELIAGKSELAVGLADGVWIGHLGASHRIGPVGVGLLYARLDQGEQVATDEEGNIIDRFDSVQTSVQIGVGYSFVERFDPGATLPSIQVSVGASLNRIHDELAPGGLFGSGMSEEATGYALDLGVALRQSFALDSGGKSGGSRLGYRLALVADNVTDGTIDFGDGFEDPLYSYLHVGLGIEGEFFPLDGLGPALRFVLMREKSISQLENDDDEFDRSALEVVVAGMAHFRIGQTDDPGGHIVASTYGVGLGLEWMGLPAGARFDYASRPQADDLARVDHFSISVGYAFD